MRTIRRPVLPARALGWLSWKYYLLDSMPARQQHSLLAAAIAVQLYLLILTVGWITGWMTFGEFLVRSAPLPFLMPAMLVVLANWTARQHRRRLTPELVVAAPSSPPAANRGR